jgi:ABC-type multidrug transport system fused ATPase/permease subunit
MKYVTRVMNEHQSAVPNLSGAPSLQDSMKAKALSSATAPAPAPAAPSSAEASLDAQEGFSIEFKNVCFSYHTLGGSGPTIVPPHLSQTTSAARQVLPRRVARFPAGDRSRAPGGMLLKNLSFKVNAGENIAIVGPSGSGKNLACTVVILMRSSLVLVSARFELFLVFICLRFMLIALFVALPHPRPFFHPVGKSTTLKLITRMLNLQSGEILLNGVSIAGVTKESVRGAVAVIPQDTCLFDETLEYNIRYGNPGASDEEVQRALEQSNLVSTVRKFAQV